MSVLKNEKLVENTNSSINTSGNSGNSNSSNGLMDESYAAMVVHKRLMSMVESAAAAAAAAASQPFVASPPISVEQMFAKRSKPNHHINNQSTSNNSSSPSPPTPRASSNSPHHNQHNNHYHHNHLIQQHRGSPPSSTSSSSSHRASSNQINTAQNSPPLVPSSPSSSSSNAALLSFLLNSAAAAAAASTQQSTTTTNHQHQSTPRSSPPHPTTTTTNSTHSHHQNNNRSSIKTLECVASSVTYNDLDTNIEYKLDGEQSKFASTFAHNFGAYIQAHIPPDTLLKFYTSNNNNNNNNNTNDLGISTTAALASHKLILYNATGYFRRKYDECACHNGVYILNMEPNLCVNSVRTCLEYIYSMGMGELELDLGASSSFTDTTTTSTSSSSQPSRRNSLVKLKQTAQHVELYDLARLAELLLEREPLPPPPPPPPPLPPQNHNTDNQSFQQQQQLSQIYTNLMIEQLLKKLYRGEQTSSPIAELVQQPAAPQPSPQQQQQQQQPRAAAPPLASLNTRFASLFNKSKLDLARFEADFELDTISRDLVIKDKYVYPSQDVTPTFLDACFENSVLINLDLPEPEKPISNEFHRHALIIFSINLESPTTTTTTTTSRAGSSSPNDMMNHTASNNNRSSMSPPSNSSTSSSSTTPTTTTTTTTNNNNSSSTPPSTTPTSSSSSSSSVELRAFKLQNFVIKSRLNFTELSLLKEDITRLFELFLNQVLAKCVLSSSSASSSSSSYYRCVVNRVCYLKKPSNCKTIRVETIKSSTDCLRAIVEYSRLDESTRELPYVFLTTHSSVYVAS